MKTMCDYEAEAALNVYNGPPSFEEIKHALENGDAIERYLAVNFWLDTLPDDSWISNGLHKGKWLEILVAAKLKETDKRVLENINDVYNYLGLAS